MEMYKQPKTMVEDLSAMGLRLLPRGNLFPVVEGDIFRERGLGGPDVATNMAVAPNSEAGVTVP